jgi:hypothetical protein
MSAAEANEELLGWPAEPFFLVGYAVRTDPSDDWGWIHITQVRGIDQGGSRATNFPVLSIRVERPNTGSGTVIAGNLPRMGDL